MKKLRITYTVAFVILLVMEILIALYIHDSFVRPYFGDVLVTVLLCCLCRIVIPKGMPALPIYVFLFAAFVEVTQYFNLVKLLGLENNALLSTIMGTSFSILDLICYAVGCLAFAVIEKVVKTALKK